MVNKNLLAIKWAELSRRLEQVRKHRKPTLEGLAADRDATELIAFNVMLAVQVCSDVANHLVMDEGWPTPRSAGEAFTRLAEHGVIDRALADQLRRAVGFRNLVVHGYAGVDLAPLERAASQGVDELESFARAVAAWAQGRGEAEPQH